MIRTRRIVRRRGFSMLELSVVLGIISLIAGVGMTMATGALKAADRVTTQERLNTIKLALDSHLKTYGYLPCPANRTLVPSDTNFGVEDRNNYVNPGTSCTAVGLGGLVLSGTAAIGGVPVRTLGLPDSYAGDAWGNKLTYAVTHALVSDPTRAATRQGGLTIRSGTIASPINLSTPRMTLPSTIPPVGPEVYGTGSSGAGARLTVTFNAIPAVSGVIANAFTNPYVVHVKSTSHNGSTTVYTGTALTATQVTLNMPWVANDTDIQLEWQEPGTAAAYAVVSHGPDGRGAFPMSGTSVPAKKRCNNDAGANTSPPPCTDNTMLTCIDIRNCDDDASFFDTTYNDGTTAATYFDDYVVWGSNANLRTATNTTQYSTCPVGVCESWCAACTTNFPGGGTTPPTSTLSPSNTTLCKKVVTTNASSCGAYCFWSVTTASGYQKCP